MRDSLKWAVILLAVCTLLLLCACGDALSQVLQLRTIPFLFAEL